MQPARLAIIPLSLVALFCVTFPADAAPPDGPGSVDQAWAAAMKANDVNAVVACYAPDAIGWFPGEGTVKGTDAIRAAYKRLLDANTITEVKLIDPTYKVTGDRAVAWGTFSMTLTPKGGGGPVVMTGRFTEVFEQRDGRWVYVVDHASADPPPAEKGKWRCRLFAMARHLLVVVTSATSWRWGG